MSGDGGRDGTFDDGFVPTSHRGLDHPFGDRTPGAGEIIPVAPGVGWVRLTMPWALTHINLWVLGDGEAASIVDCGPDLPESVAGWDALFAGPLAGRRIDQVIVTHMHPDHIGLAGMLCARDGAVLAMTRGEWLTAQYLRTTATPVPPPEARRWWRMMGYSAAQEAAAAAGGWGSFARIVRPIPGSYRRLRDGEGIAAGGRDWRVVVGSGHSPEHACLLDEAGGVLIAGDQVLPRITSNVSVGVLEPHGDPLGDWLDSIDRLLDLPAGLLVLPAHGLPFRGLHTRLAALRDGHHARLDAVHTALDRPRTALEVFAPLFGREIGADQLGLAGGEALAHLRRLARDGRAVERDDDGVARFVAA